MFQGDYKVHILVLEAFVGPRPDGLVGCHKDDNTTNNAVENLYWGSESQNTHDRCRKNNKLTAAQAAEIRARRATGESGRALAKEFGVSEQMICDVYKNRSYFY